MDLAPDVLRAHGVEELPAGAAELFKIQMQHVEMPVRLHPGILLLKDQLRHEIWAEEQRFENPHLHYLDMSPAYYEMKMQMLSRS